ncbi:MAG: 50S ribosome-binding GTPase [Methyloprofundus sp.]|nr:50S ribosome-binding GTPase [Methyloprofundus sp.]MBW6453741.1 50S ribosome-binding GTPase [Methyloprofundus sp.]
MAYEYSDLVAQAKSWATEVITRSWASEAKLHDLLHYEARTPESLFSDPSSRPLIVAFLGGTGVGKSTLLNRLAGQDIARTGVVRPTSKEVTLFHHNSIKIAQLPSRLPIDKITIAEHSDASKKHIIWIDMPDFDSAEQGNQQLVLEWLPHIDVLVYVVSPERYRDNKAWQLLLAEGGKHAWIFVLNQSDRGEAAQYQDFIKQLYKAGFNDPIVYQSCCAIDKSATQIDEFAALETAMQALATENTVVQLELRGDQVRKAELSKVLVCALEVLGSPASSQELIPFWHKQWQNFEALLVEAMALPLQQLAEYYALHSSDLSAKELDNHSFYKIHHGLWDKWAQARLEDALDALIIQADTLDLPVTPIKQAVFPLRENTQKTIAEKTLLSVRKALINPGNVVQRALIKIAYFAEIILPMAAMAWVGYQVFIEFYEASLAKIPHYVGVDFAVNSVMLIAIAWLFPYFLKKKLKPSIEKAAHKGLHNGLLSALQSIELEVIQLIKQNDQTQKALRQQAEKIISDCQDDNKALFTLPDNSPLERMLL